MKTKQRRDKLIKEEKQKNYVVNWNIADGKKQHDALDDVFATYYFANPNVKKHLKHFSKVAKKEPQTTDLLRMTFLLDHKYKKSTSREDKYLHYLDRQKQNSSLKSQKINFQNRSHQPKSLEKIRKQQKFQVEPENSKDQHIDLSKAESFNENRLPKVKQQKIYQSQDEINREVATKKKVFLQYLEKKREQIKNKKVMS